MAKVDSAAFLSRLERLYSHWEVRLRRWAIFGVGFRSERHSREAVAARSAGIT